MSNPRADLPYSRKQRKVARVQYAALPYRQRAGARTEVMLITSRETGRWLIPKGWRQKGKSARRSAAREAREEAGVIGKIEHGPIGSYAYKKLLNGGNVVLCEVRVFPLEVKRQRKTWPEKPQREVRWFSRAQAAKIVSEPALRTIIRNFHKHR